MKIFLAALVIAAPSYLQNAVEPPGKLVDIGGYRMHLWCTGPSTAGRPTVVLSAGGGGFALDWALVQPAIAKSTRVCSYDRANYGWSDAGPNPRTLQQEAFELHAALRAAGERAPFVLVGHSLGGLVVRLYAQAHPDQAAGVVLVDPAHESGRYGYRGELVQVRTLATDRPVPPPASFQQSPPVPLVGEAADQCRKSAAAARVYGPYLKLPPETQRLVEWLLQHPQCLVTQDDYLAEEMAAMFAARSRNPQPLGTLPLIVISRTQDSPPPGVDAEEWRREKLAQKADLATLSSEGRLVIAPLSGHHVHIDNPAAVVDAIHEVLQRAGSRGHM